MRDEVGIADLKAHLSAHLGRVRRGHTLVVMDRKVPVARITPIEQQDEPLVIRKAARGAPPLGKVRWPPPIKTSVDPVELLLADRASGR